MKRKLRFELRSYEDDDGLYWLELWCGGYRSLHRSFGTITERRLATENIYKALKKIGGKVGWVPHDRKKIPVRHTSLTRRFRLWSTFPSTT